MGASQARAAHHYHELVLKTGFSKEQLKNLHYRFQQLSANEETISRGTLESIPSFAYNPIKGKIIEAFFDKRNQGLGDIGSFTEINFEQFAMVMSHFRPASSNMTDVEKQAVRKDKLRFLFNMHDTNNDGTITLAEYRKVVEELLSTCEDIDVEAAEEITEAAMTEVRSINKPDMESNESYEGITFEHFEQMLKDLEMESNMHIRFLAVDTTPLHCCKSSH